MRALATMAGPFRFQSGPSAIFSPSHLHKAEITAETANYHSAISPLAIQIRPLARLDEARPVIRMPPLPVLEHLQLYLPQRLPPSLPLLQRTLEGHHQLPRPFLPH